MAIDSLDTNTTVSEIEDPPEGLEAGDVVIQESHKDSPYLEKIYTVTERFYNPDYGDDRVCKCGHRYIEHFLIEDHYPWGCYYCSCLRFEEVTYH